MSTDQGSFSAYLTRHLPLVENALLEHLPQATRHSKEADDLNRYLYDPLEGFVMSGGKRLRPILCLLGSEAVGARPEVALPLASAIELFQAAALVHDDIADQSELRRGKPCLHITQGVGLATNAGDAALVAVTATLARSSSYSPQLRLQLIDEICFMEERTLEGQALDLGWARDHRWDISVEDYLEMARHKTAFYSGATPLALGALCGGGTNSQVEGLRAFGMHCGLAFQIQDDLLNLVGSAEKQGKDFRSDITEGKRTLVMVWALEHAHHDERDELIDILSSGTTDEAALERAVHIAQSTGALEHARTYARQLISHAKKTLVTLDIAEESHAVLRSMADYFVDRGN